MKPSNFEAILERIAKTEHTTKEHIRQEIQKAMDLAMASPDPLIQAKWAQIPKSGKKLTLEEFVTYMATQVHSK